MRSFACPALRLPPGRQLLVRLTLLPALALCVHAAGCGPAAPRNDTVAVGDTHDPHFECVGVDDGMFGFLDVETCAEGDARDIARAVEQFAVAGQTLRGYDAIWAEGALGRVSARLPEREACEVTLAPDAAQRWLSIVNAGADLDSLEMGVTRVEGEVRGDEASVRAQVELRWGSGEDAMGEVHEYALRRGVSGWRAHEVRIRPVYWAIPDESETYDAAFWAALDQAAGRAREAQAGLTGPALLDAQRTYASAVAAAQCVQEAHAVMLAVTRDPAAHAGDWGALARLARDLGRFDESEAAAARARVTPLGPVQARGLLGCWSRESTCPPDEELAGDEGGAAGLDDHDYDYEYEYDCMPREVCEVDVIARRDVSPDPDARALALVRERRDEAGAESFFLVLGVAGEWVHAELLAEGPQHDGESVGVQAFSLSPPERAALGPAARAPADAEAAGAAAPLDGLTVRYELREREAAPAGTGGSAAGVDASVVEVVERGVLACVSALEQPRCERFPERVERQVGGARPRVATATVTFPGDGTVVVRAGRGRDARIVAGQRPIAPAAEAGALSGHSR